MIGIVAKNPIFIIKQKRNIRISVAEFLFYSNSKETFSDIIFDFFCGPTKIYICTFTIFPGIDPRTFYLFLIRMNCWRTFHQNLTWNFQVLFLFLLRFASLLRSRWCRVALTSLYIDMENLILVRVRVIGPEVCVVISPLVSVRIGPVVCVV